MWFIFGRFHGTTHVCSCAYKATDLEELRNGKNSSYAESFNAVARRLEAMSFNMSLPHFIFMLQVTPTMS